MRTRVKICGFTKPEDARIAVRLGVDALGLVFYPASPRHVDIVMAQAIVRSLPPFVSVVGLFVDAVPATVNRTLAEVSIDLLQFHGNEPGDYCKSFAKPYIKAIRVQAQTDFSILANEYATAAGLLLDAYHPDAYGGTGLAFDWNLIPQDFPLPLILAGGLTPGNIRHALEQTAVYAVDVSSGVEAAKGIKDTDKMTAFLHEVYNFDSTRLTRCTL